VAGRKKKNNCPECGTPFVVLSIPADSVPAASAHNRNSAMSTNATLSEPQDPARDHAVVSREEWLAAREQLLEKGKEATRLSDRIAAERRALPWVKVDKTYLFDTPGGKVSLADLFAGRSQLVIYHFMFGPDWQEGCPSCSFVSDHFDGTLPHLAARDVTVAAVSRAPLAKIEDFKKRMGWRFDWVSSSESDFNYDFHVSFTDEEIARGKVNYNFTEDEFPSAEAPGASVFYKDAEGNIFHTYSTYGRGVEALMSTYRILDMVPKGRDEDGLDFSMAWVRYHDKYGTDEFADADKPYWPEVGAESESCGCGTGSKS
jgi:predicted dithiol-disulfide oxidoreductase (DUF899 family)